MNKKTVLLSGLVLIILVGALYMFGRVEQEDISPNDTEILEPETEVTDTRSETYMDPESGLSFSYRGDEDGYHLDVLPSRESGHIKTLVLTPSKDHISLLEATIPRESPPTITIEVYQNTAGEDAESWTESHPRISNIATKTGDVDDIMVNGAPAIQYSGDGLYPSTITVVTHKSFVYVITGAYLDETSPTRTDYNPLLASMTFM